MNRPNFAGERSRKLGKSWTAGRGGRATFRRSETFSGGGRIGRVEPRVDSRVVGSDS